jgi:hypothetical protein
LRFSHKANKYRYADELAAYAVSEYENAPRTLPQRIRKWVEDLFAAIRMAVARAWPESAIGRHIVENMSAKDFAALARGMLRESVKGVGKRADGKRVEPMFSKKVKKKKEEPPLTLEQAQKRWAREIARAESSKDQVFILALDVPQAMRRIGMTLNKLEVTPAGIIHSAEKHPDVPKHVWDKLPTLISRPLYAFEFIAEHAAGKDAAGAERLAEIGLKRGAIPRLPNGLPDYQDTRVRAAILRFVNEAMAQPSAGANAMWMNDPRFALVAHLKRFTFGFSYYINRRAWRLIKRREFRPLLPLVFMAPMAVATTGLRDLATPASEAYKEAWGVSDYALSGIERTGLAGRASIVSDVLRNIDYGGSGIESLAPSAEMASKAVRQVAKGNYGALMDLTPAHQLGDLIRSMAYVCFSLELTNKAIAAISASAQPVNLEQLPKIADQIARWEMLENLGDCNIIEEINMPVRLEVSKTHTEEHAGQTWRVAKVYFQERSGEKLKFSQQITPAWIFHRYTEEADAFIQVDDGSKW